VNTSQTSNRTTRTTDGTTRTTDGTARTARAARTAFATVLVTALAAAVAVQPASARQDPGPSAPTTYSHQCLLQRVGTEFVRCDDLTGNGVPAPAWVDQR
jgi:hypothetical protein